MKRVDEDLADLRLVPHVETRELPAECDLVAQCLGHQIGVGVASDIAKKRLMKGVPAVIVAVADKIGKTHAKDAASEREIAGVPGRKVGRISRDHHEIGTSHSRNRHDNLPDLQSTSAP